MSTRISEIAESGSFVTRPGEVIVHESSNVKLAGRCQQSTLLTTLPSEFSDCFVTECPAKLSPAAGSDTLSESFPRHSLHWDPRV
jgi:hypothetical protein